MTTLKSPAAKPRMLGQRSTVTLMRLLGERGLSTDEIDTGLDYVESLGARTVREAYELALSRVLFTDAQLAQGMRFTCDEAQPAPPPAD